MKKGKEINSRVFATSSAFNYIPEEDRYQSRTEKPQFKFNIIGTGIMGQEHIRITLLEGRADIHGVYNPNPGGIEAARQNFAMMAPGK